MPAAFPQTDPWFAALAPDRRRALLGLARASQALAGVRVSLKIVFVISSRLIACEIA